MTRTSDDIGYLIPIINKLQDVFNVLGEDSRIDLPQIVVVGSQSSGKSSVLESIVGRDFLPRGSGICTRRPLILQLVRSAEQTKERGEFLHLPGKSFRNFEDIRQEIERDTNRISGSNKNVSREPIRLRIYSPNVLNLTLVDLPGIAKNPVADQPKDIEYQIKNMVLEFIKKPNAIILAVSAANTDLATSDALHIAREVDPDMNRTVGVLTKIDLMDRGTNVREILTGQSQYDLRLGWIGVVCRGQQDIDERKTVKSGLLAESEYFRNNPLYADLAAKLGTPYLAHTLNHILCQHIQSALPLLKSKVNQMLNQTLREMDSFGVTLENRSQKGAVLLNLLTKFSSNYSETVHGQGRGASQAELIGGARISYVFHEAFNRMLDTVKPSEWANLDEIRTIVRNSSGTTPSLFIPEHAFEVFVKRVMSRLEGPSLRCLDLVYEEIVKIIRATPSKELQRYGNLQTSVIDVSVKLVRKLHGPCKAFLSDLVQCELSYVNTLHPDFIGASAAIAGMFVFHVNTIALSNNVREVDMNELDEKDKRNNVKGQKQKVAPQPVPKRGAFGSLFSSSVQAQPELPQYEKVDYVPSHLKVTGPVPENERLACAIIPELLQSYYTIGRKKIQDTVPKAVMYFVVNQSIQYLHQTLVSELYKEDLFDDLLEEDSTIAAKRKACHEMLKMLQEASDVLTEVREFSVGVEI